VVVLMVVSALLVTPPVLFLIRTSLFPRSIDGTVGDVSLRFYWQMLGRPTFFSSLVNTLMYAIGTTVVAIMSGVLASGIKLGFGSVAKSLSRGRAAESGIVASILASAELGSSVAVGEEQDGFYQAFRDGAQPVDTAGILGNSYESLALASTLKPYPGCACSHPAVDAVLRPKREYGFTLDQVESAESVVTPSAANYFKFSEPTVPLHAKYSPHHVAATAVIDGGGTLESFDEAKLWDTISPCKIS